MPCLALQVGLSQHYAMAIARTGDWASALIGQAQARSCLYIAQQSTLAHRHTGMLLQGSGTDWVGHASCAGRPVTACTVPTDNRVPDLAQVMDTDAGKAWLEAAETAHMRAMDAASAAGSFASQTAAEGQAAAKGADAGGSPADP